MAEFLSGIYLWIKSAHLIFVIAWMAGMMYLPRLFVYQHQSEKGGEAERYFIQMQRRLLKGIINPSMIFVWVLGILMLIANPAILSQGWFHVKLALVVAISAIHGYYASSRRKFEKGERPRTEKFWRMMNEAPFLAMIVIVIMVIVKPF
ncbi:protoporphyrinogen oxidase HemJ [Hyphococcus luteus]|uniref:Protoporphyrinogen IX oxidase n=1 Tax=Hyphococcus luteus TaxID=2058213 RepID=A0A2S7K6T6_9PROT|nr:protoporphyrinogen oxidase HemJ [Marinicaulis flavus]PQA88202.1 protoporphyrinogen oxidase HemJ [Marinicaulis flavus]